MAEPDAAQPDQINIEVQQTPRKQERLKYLVVVHVAAIQALACLSRMYDFAKENSGPLKPGVHTVEGTVKAVVGPVYEKFQSVPLEILKFVDRKVGDAVEEVERHVPSLVKGAPQLARSLSNEVHRAGVVGTAAELAKVAYTKAEPAAKMLYTKCEPVAEHYAVSAWRALNKLPVFPRVAQLVLPAAACWTERYNKAVCYSARKGYALSGCLPLVPVERIAEVFGEKNGEAQ